MAVILFGVFIALLLLGVPVAFAICSAAATTMFAGFGDAKMMIVVQRMFASCDSFSLIAVPFFIFAATCIAGGRISKVLVEFCESLLGMIKGGLSVVSVLAGMFFAAISGSGAATTAAVGATLVPELKKRRLPRGFRRRARRRRRYDRRRHSAVRADGSLCRHRGGKRQPSVQRRFPAGRHHGHDAYRHRPLSGVSKQLSQGARRSPSKTWAKPF